MPTLSHHRTTLITRALADIRVRSPESLVRAHGSLRRAYGKTGRGLTFDGKSRIGAAAAYVNRALCIMAEPEKYVDADLDAPIALNRAAGLLSTLIPELS